ncbi:hypothetical protein ABPG74_003732 [Tetrahymena malaccensis]
MTERSESKSVKSKKMYYCRCGSKYNLNSTLSNHIKIKHDNDKNFQINKGDRGRPPKQSPEYNQIKDGFVPNEQQMLNIIILMNQYVKILESQNQKDFYENIIQNINEWIQREEQQIDSDERIYYWYNQSKSLFDTLYKQMYESYQHDILTKLLKACYNISLLSFRNQTDQIIPHFFIQMDNILKNNNNQEMLNNQLNQ